MNISDSARACGAVVGNSTGRASTPSLSCVAAMLSCSLRSANSLGIDHGLWYISRVVLNELRAIHAMGKMTITMKTDSRTYLTAFISATPPGRAGTGG